MIHTKELHTHLTKHLNVVVVGCKCLNLVDELVKMFYK